MTMPEKPELKLSVDYGQSWPLSDIFWEDRPDWATLIEPALAERLRAWAAFFTQNADEETGLFGSEEARKWFDLEGFRLRDDLEAQIGNLYDFRLDLWF